MVSKYRAVDSQILALFVAVLSVNFGINSAVKTLFVEELCSGSGHGKINLSVEKSVILSSVPSEEQNCKILVETDRSSSLVVAFSQYRLYGNDSLAFTDRHGFKLVLAGEGNFVDERKSVILESPVNIHYFTQHLQTNAKLKFQIVLTQITDSPCSYDEYKCQNNKCIAKELACDQHNHCGDLSHQDKCTPETSTPGVPKSTDKKSSPFVVAFGITASILIVVVIALIIKVAYMFNKNQKRTQPSTGSYDRSTTKTKSGFNF